MAARKRTLRLTDAWRDKIRTSMLINRLHDHALGKIELSVTQIKSIEILLRKTAPDLLAVEQTTQVQVNYVAVLPEAAQDIDEWRENSLKRLTNLQ